jgi:dienelactone hydrolase
LLPLALMIIGTILICPALADDPAPAQQVQEEVWALPLPLPVLAYVARPVGSGPFPLVIMNHGIAIDPRERSFFPLIEFRDAALWFARRGYFVVSPVRYGGTRFEVPERGIHSDFFAHVGHCDKPNFKAPGLFIATLDQFVIDYMVHEKLVAPGKIVVVGQSGGGWGAIALSSLNLPSVRAIITFAAGRGGRVDGKPNNNCAPDKLVEATAEFGRTSRIPMLWLYIENDSYFGPEISRRMHQAFTAAGGQAEYHLFPPFGNEGHIFIDSRDSLPLWTPLVSEFLDKHP